MVQGMKTSLKNVGLEKASETSGIWLFFGFWTGLVSVLYTTAMLANDKIHGRVGAVTGGLTIWTIKFISAK